MKILPSTFLLHPRTITFCSLQTEEKSIGAGYGIFRKPDEQVAAKQWSIMLNFNENEKLTTVLAVESFDPGYYIVMATKNGTVKKTDLMAFSRPRSGGIIALYACRR